MSAAAFAPSQPTGSGSGAIGSGHNSLWKQTYQHALQHQLTHPYLRLVTFVLCYASC